MYSVPITRLHPTAFIVLIDQSGSMKEKIVFAGAGMSKARAVSLVTNSFIDELIFRARREGGPRDYYDIAVLGYSGDGVCPLLAPAGEFTTPSRLAAAGIRREKMMRERLLPSGRTVVAVTEHNVWTGEKAVGVTPMCGALRQGLSMVEWWCRQRRNRDSYPPTVINITDGEASDCGSDEVKEVAGRIRATGTSDGNTILMNIHLAQGGGNGQGGLNAGENGAVLFPSAPGELPDHRYARLLWDISSDMPECCNDMISSIGKESAAPPFRAVGWGSHIGGVAAMMNIGSINSVIL